MTYIEEYILKHWKSNTVAMMADQLNLTPAIVRNAAKKMGIDPISPKDLKVAFILDNYERLSQEEMAECLECTKSTVGDLLDEYGLRAKSRMKGETPLPAIKVSPALTEYLQEISPKPTNKKRPPAIYNQSGSPYGIADEIKQQS
jgi:hypothetical protein